VVNVGLHEAKEIALQRPFRHSYMAYFKSKIRSLTPNFVNRRFSFPSSSTQVNMSPERWQEMRQVAADSFSKVKKLVNEDRIQEIRAHVDKLLKNRGYKIVSKLENLRERRKRVTDFEEGRQNAMRILTIKYIQEKVGILPTADELKNYHDLNFELLKIKIAKLQQKVRVVVKKTKEFVHRIHTRESNLKNVSTKWTIQTGTEENSYTNMTESSLLASGDKDLKNKSEPLR